MAFLPFFSTEIPQLWYHGTAGSTSSMRTGNLEHLSNYLDLLCLKKWYLSEKTLKGKLYFPSNFETRQLYIGFRVQGLQSGSLKCLLGHSKFTVWTSWLEGGRSCVWPGGVFWNTFSRLRYPDCGVLGPPSAMLRTPNANLPEPHNHCIKLHCIGQHLPGVWWSAMKKDIVHTYVIRPHSITGEPWTAKPLTD